MTERLLCLLLGYAFGNILTAEIVCRVKAGVSASAIGTGNPGMANVMANLGFAPGIVVLGGDLLKTIAACLIAGVIGKNIGSIAVFYAGAGSVMTTFSICSSCSADFPDMSAGGAALSGTRGAAGGVMD